MVTWGGQGSEFADEIEMAEVGGGLVQLASPSGTGTAVGAERKRLFSPP